MIGPSNSDCVVISGQACAGSSSLAKLLADQLGYTYFSVGEYVRQTLIQANDVTLSEAYTNGGALLHSVLQRNIDSLQIERARAGQTVIDSKLGLYILRGHYEFGIWLNADWDERVRRLASRGNISLGLAASTLRLRESQEKKMWAELYGADVLELEQYAHCVEDTTLTSINELSTRILERMGR